MKQHHVLQAGDTITLSTVNTAATLVRQDDESDWGLIYSGSRVFGPYTHVTHWEQDGGTVSIGREIQSRDEVGSSAADVVQLVGVGAPEDAAQATLGRNPTGDDNALMFTAVAYGAAGNSISIEYLDPSSNDAALSIDVSGTTVVVNLATDSGGDITSTAAEILAAWEAKPEAAVLATVEIDASDSGSGDDGSGVVTALAAAAFTGGAGTGIDVAGPGSQYTDYDTPGLYFNTGTKAVPVWFEIATS